MVLRKIVKLTTLKLGTFSSKDNIKKVKSKLTKWEKIFSTCTTDRGLIFKLGKEL